MVSVIQTSLASGEIAPSFHASVDLAKYHSGLARCENAFVDFRGGVTNRPGTEFIGRAPDDIDDVILIPFQFKTTQNYALEFSHHKMRVLMNGGFVLKDPLEITEVKGPRITVAPGHGIETGDFVVLNIPQYPSVNGRTFRVSLATRGEIRLATMSGGPMSIPELKDDPYIRGGTVSPFFDLETPYDKQHLIELKFVQSADVLTITHRRYAQRDLTRQGHAEWTLEEIKFGSALEPPTNLRMVNDPGQTTTEGSRNAMYAYVVTSLGEDEEESIGSERLDAGPYRNIGTEAGSLEFQWDPVEGADNYAVYKANPAAVNTTDVGREHELIPVGASFGFIGTTKSPVFTDTNILADFSQSPPQNFDPFADGAVLRVKIINQGSGYDQRTVTATIQTSTGSGAILDPVVVGGKVVAVIVRKQGEHYLPTDKLVISPGGGSGGGGGTGSGAAAHVIGYTAERGIAQVQVDAGGSNYKAPQVAVDSPPSPDLIGASLAAVVGAGGAITEILIVSPGAGYNPESPPGITISDTGTAPAPDPPDPGKDATGELVLSEQTGNWPAATAFFQQRKVYGSSDNSVETLWMSQPGLFKNFDVSRPLKDDDSITAGLVSKQVNDIKYMVEMPGGLVVLTGGGNAWQVSGGGQNEPISPISLLSTPQAYNGCADVEPIPINYDIIYVQSKGTVVRDLSYNFFTNIYTGDDISVMSNHLVTGYTIRQWAWASDPFKLIWMVREEDGALLTLTFMKEQKIIGWGWGWTKGLFRSVCSIQEGGENAVYFVVKRFLSGRWVQTIERLASKKMPFGIEDAWYVDCGLENELPTPDAAIVLSGIEGNIAVTASKSIFGPNDIGKVFRANGGIGFVTGVPTGNILEVSLYQKVDKVQPGSKAADPNAKPVPLPVQAGDWTLTKQITEVSGLEHLEGEWLSILADGSVLPQQQVMGGRIRFDQPVSKVIAGLPYASRLQTLRLEAAEPTIQGSRKKISAVTLRVVDTRGLQVGSTFETTFPIKERNGQPYTTPIELVTGDERIVMDPSWNTEGQVCVQQLDPLPFTVTGFIPEVVAGDTYGRQSR